MANDKWMNIRSGSLHIRVGPRCPLCHNRLNRELFGGTTTNTTACCREGSWRVVLLPTVIMAIHGRKSIWSGWRYFTWSWLVGIIPGIVEIWRTIWWNTRIGMWRWRVNRSDVCNIWARISSGRYSGGMFSKYCVLSKKIVICKKPEKIQLILEIWSFEVKSYSHKLRGANSYKHLMKIPLRCKYMKHVACQRNNSCWNKDLKLTILWIEK